jgi:uncharacterized protein (TIGR03067 family)
MGKVQIFPKEEGELMNAVLLTVVASGLLLGTDGKDDAAKADREKLQGKWKVTSGVIDGNAIPKGQLGGELNYKGDKYSWSFGDQSGTGTFKLDPSKNPKQLDAVPGDGPAQGQTVEHIYEIDGDKLKLCFALPGTDRPKEFKSTAGSGLWLFTYKRAK